MKNNYLIDCSDTVVVKKKQEEIIKKMKFNEATISIYDLEEQDISDVLEDLNTYSLFSSRKVIIVKNVFSNYNEKRFNLLLKYIDNFSSDNLLIMIVDKLDNRLNIVKKIKQNPNIEVMSLELDSFLYAKNLLKDYQIKDGDIRNLVEKCRGDITKLTNECQKLMLYKIDSLIIDSDDINNLVVKKLGDSSETLFSFINYLISKDKKKAIEKYQELLDYNIDNSSIIGLLASQLKLIYQIKILKDKKLTNSEILSTLNLKSLYQIKKIEEYSYSYTYHELSNLINQIANLDYSIKSGKIDSKLAIDMLVINL